MNAKSAQLLSIELEFNLIKTKRVKPKFLNHQTVQIGDLFTIRKTSDPQTILE